MPIMSKSQYDPAESTEPHQGRLQCFEVGQIGAAFWDTPGVKRPGCVGAVT